MRWQLLIMIGLLFALAACQNAAPTSESPTERPPTSELPASESPADSPTEPPPASEPPADSPPAGWTRQQFGTAWDLAYPTDWQVNAAGAHEGALQLEGEHAGHAYRISLGYPIGLAESLEAWVDSLLAGLTPEQRAGVAVADLTVAGTAAKKVLNLPLPEGIGHQALVWRSEGKNPRQISIVQTDGQPVDAAAMEALFNQFLAQINE